MGIESIQFCNFKDLRGWAGRNWSRLEQVEGNFVVLIVVSY